MPPVETFARVFEPCAHCHQIGPGARTAMGPQLEGVIGRRAGALQAYPFSQALRESGIIWTPDLLDRFIAAPQTVVPGTRMMFAGIEDPARRAALVAFIGAPRPD
jgi:cytochrome c